MGFCNSDGYSSGLFLSFFFYLQGGNRICCHKYNISSSKVINSLLVTIKLRQVKKFKKKYTDNIYFC